MRICADTDRIDPTGSRAAALEPRLGFRCAIIGLDPSLSERVR
jgi:hypothetical protein